MEGKLARTTLKWDLNNGCFPQNLDYFQFFFITTDVIK